MLNKLRHVPGHLLNTLKKVAVFTIHCNLISYYRNYYLVKIF